MMEKNAKIYVAGHRGMVGSAIVRELQRQGYTNIITRTHKELDLTRQDAVEEFFAQEKPEYVLLITKRLYNQTAQYFHTNTNCVERNLRTLIQACWRQPDHSLLERIAGHPLSQPPTNAQFIDMVAAFLRK